MKLANSEMFRVSSRLAQAVLGFATLACIQSEHGVAQVADIKAGLAITDEEFEGALAELQPIDAMWRVDESLGHIDCVQTTPTYQLCIGSLSPTSRPKPRAWDYLRKLVIERDTIDGVVRCTYCRVVPDSIHIDHILALERGGSNHTLNLVVACGFCNASKGTKLVNEWLCTVPGRAA